ncbi:unnamed protein product [Heligmosomoides polygyrus]|uniref:Peptidase A2 domain-containing protein n=1 Tax=Heligmosomoides polygyrus TaxID=6339 RepID=A0A183G7H6_HELPZ|nr:unnamed protein product [Heligmosomoides polygyrus]
MEAYASLVDKWLGATVADLQSGEGKLFGEKAIEKINIFGIEAVALLDTGSQTTIIPLLLLKRAIESNVDLDEYVTRLPHPKVKVRDASGNVMEFLDVVRVAITFRDQVEEVSAYVGRGLDEVVILGTNALELFGMRLQQVGTTGTPEQDPGVGSTERSGNTDSDVCMRTMYRDLGEIASILERSESSCCVLVGPTSDISIPKKE